MDFTKSAFNAHHPLLSSSSSSIVAANMQSSSSSSSSAFSWLDSSFLSSPFDYVIDMMSNALCVQLVLKRPFFARFGDDGQKAIEQLSALSVNQVDFNEFPGPVLSRFFEWMQRQTNNNGHQRSSTVATFCVVCGERHPHHNHAIHSSFWSRVDQKLVRSFELKGRDAFGFIKTLLSYMLQNPSAHDFLREVVAALHCPFCASTTGEHNHALHRVWQRALNVDYGVGNGSNNSSGSGSGGTIEPAPTDTNSPDYVQRAFKWIVDQIHPSIPPFLLNFNYVRSFMSCLIAIWQKVRIG
jgi:hypothetical protein